MREYFDLERRRHFLKRSALSLGAATVAALGGRDLRAAGARASSPAMTTGLPDVPHYAPKAKRAIYLFMAGAPAQQDMLDYKPKLNDLFQDDLRTMKGDDGELILKNRVTTMTSGQASFPVAPSKYRFEQCGPSGAWISELLPYTKQIAGEIAICKSLWTEAINHDPAITYIQTGSQIPGRPSLGAWLSYGLGSVNEDLPSFIVMTPSWTGRRQAQAIYNRLWGAGFLPSKHGGVLFRRTGDPVLYLSNPTGVSDKVRRRMIDAVNKMNRKLYEEVGDPSTNDRIANYEMAYRMQASVPELTDTRGEPAHIKEMYGPDVDKPGTFASSCLLARRMMERGVRFVQVFHRGWDQHFNIANDLPNQCRDIDQPAAALVRDLKQRGMLEDTLVIWGGEFGRTTYCQGKLTKENYGRDHHPSCFSIWMAGGGVKPGIVYGETDAYGVNVVKDPIHINDLNATILHQLGIDHQKLSVPYQGLDVRLTGVEDANVVNDILL